MIYVNMIICIIPTCLLNNTLKHNTSCNARSCYISSKRRDIAGMGNYYSHDVVLSLRDCHTSYMEKTRF